MLTLFRRVCSGVVVDGRASLTESPPIVHEAIAFPPVLQEDSWCETDRSVVRKFPIQWRTFLTDILHKKGRLIGAGRKPLDGLQTAAEKGYGVGAGAVTGVAAPRPHVLWLLPVLDRLPTPGCWDGPASASKASCCASTPNPTTADGARRGVSPRQAVILPQQWWG